MGHLDKDGLQYAITYLKPKIEALITIPEATSSRNGLATSTQIQTLNSLNNLASTWNKAMLLKGDPTGEIDLDSYTQAGFYYLRQTGTTLSNGPRDSAQNAYSYGTLYVYRSKVENDSSSPNVIVQLFVHSERAMFRRYTNNGGSSWSNWVRYGTARLADKIWGILTVDGFIENSLNGTQWTTPDPEGTLKIYAVRNHQSNINTVANASTPACAATYTKNGQTYNTNYSTYGNSVYFNIDSGWIGLNRRYLTDTIDTRTGSYWTIDTLYSLNVGGTIQTKGTVAQDTDLSTMAKPGVWYLAGSRNYEGLGNLSTNTLHDYGVFIVYDPLLTVSENIAAQMFITDNGHAIRYRNTNSAGTWSNWNVVYNLPRTLNVTSSLGTTTHFKRDGNTVTFKIYGSASQELSTGGSSSNSTVSLGQLNANTSQSIFIPTSQYEENAWLVAGTGGRFGKVFITTDGNIIIGRTINFSGTAAYANIENGTGIRHQGSYIVQTSY